MELTDAQSNSTYDESLYDNIKYSLTEELVNYILTPMNLAFGMYVLIKQIRKRNEFWYICFYFVMIIYRKNFKYFFHIILITLNLELLFNLIDMIFLPKDL
jgi:hypothetical protein